MLRSSLRVIDGWNQIQAEKSRADLFLVGSESDWMSYVEWSSYDRWSLREVINAFDINTEKWRKKIISSIFLKMDELLLFYSDFKECVNVPELDILLTKKEEERKAYIESLEFDRFFNLIESLFVFFIDFQQSTIDLSYVDTWILPWYAYTQIISTIVNDDDAYNNLPSIPWFEISEVSFLKKYHDIIRHFLWISNNIVTVEDLSGFLSNIWIEIYDIDLINYIIYIINQKRPTLIPKILVLPNKNFKNNPFLLKVNNQNCKIRYLVYKLLGIFDRA